MEKKMISRDIYPKFYTLHLLEQDVMHLTSI